MLNEINLARADLNLLTLFEAMCEVVQSGRGARARRRAGLRAKS
jgi:hypothetical protein